MRINESTICGHLSQDTKLHNNGKQDICYFTVAVNRPPVKGKENQIADYIPCVAFGNVGKTINKCFKKGSEIYLKTFQSSSSITDEDGNLKTIISNVVISFQFVGKKNRNDDENTDYDEPPF